MRDVRIWLATFVFASLFFCPANVNAQPGNDDDFETLRKQVAELQAQLKNGTSPKLENEKQFENNERVRNLGRQIVRRKPVREEEKDIALQIRLYDLSDLFAVSPNYPATLPNELQANRQLFANAYGQPRGSGGGGLGGGGGGGGFGGGSGGVFRMAPLSPASPPKPRVQEAGNLNMQAAQVTLNQLVETIKETVKPEMWGTSNTSARIKFLGNTLLVTATEDMHEQINDLLNLFREHWGKRRTISIQTWWVRTDQGNAFELIDENVTESTGAGVVSKDRWKAFFAKAKEEKKIVYSATLTGHNNQTLHALSGRQISLTVDALPLESSNSDWHIKSAEDLDENNPFGDGEDDPNSSNLGFLSRKRQVIGFRPVEASFHEGAAFQVTPLATRGGNFVILDLQSKVNELVGGKRDEKIFVENEGKRVEVQLDNTDYLACRFNSTLRCPKDEVVLAGSMTWDPSAQEESPEIYLFVRATVHTIEEDQSDWKQTAVAAPSKPETKSAESVQ